MEAIKPRKFYSVSQIAGTGLFLNTKGEPSIFTVYRLMKRYKIKTRNVSCGKEPRYLLKGSDVIKLVDKVYKK